MFAIPFHNLTATDLPRVGGKGANLGEMTRAGFPVPPGFCVSTAAFHAFMASHPHLDDFYAQLGQIPVGDVAQVRQIGEAAREQLRQLPIPPAVAEAVQAAWRELGTDKAYAVRSSATAEDLPSASFAGQQDTYLNIRGEAELLAKMRDCWVSLFTDRAILYRQQNKFDHRHVALSVVVQQMVQPEVAGILFTADPMTGQRHTAAIDASFGLGEALVAGLVTADLYHVDKRNWRILRQQIGEKKLAIRSLPNGGTEQISVAEAERHLAALSEAQIVELAQWGAKIEAHYGRPQDIEWALADGQFYIVQSRPITSLFPLPQPAPPPEDGLHIYLSFGHVQVMTDPMSQMGREIIALILPFGRPVGMWKNPYLPSAGGRVYMDVTPLLRHPLMGRTLPRILSVADPLFVRPLQELMNRPEFTPPHGKRAATRTLLRYLGPIGGRVLLNLWVRPPEKGLAKAEALITKNLTAVQQEVEAAEPGLPRLRIVRQRLGHIFIDLALQVAPFLATGMLSTKWLERLVDGLVAPADVAALGRGLHGNVTTEMDMAVGDVADAAQDVPALIAHLQRRDLPATEIIRTAAHIPHSAPFLAAWNQFVAQYGMRGPSEIDLGRLRWAEEPSALLQVVVGNLQRGQMGQHRHYHAQLAAEREAAAERIVAAVRGAGKWLRLPLVRRLMRVSRHLMAVREHPKFALIRLLWLAKQAIWQGADELVANGRLTTREDVWHLSLNELIEALANPTQDVHGLVATRREEARRWAQLTPPRILSSEGEIPTVGYAAVDAPAGALIGSPVSAGVVEGIARVITDPYSEVLNPGEILIAPFTDPGWTPLFINAAGLVMEVGGLMTHGSVVAREYGIPAVVGVLEATRKIHTGQRIRVDGGAGFVVVLDEGRGTRDE
ncbi:MAG: phosphoenolpyruvate synthase [Chloroflexi bacterium]|nr:phosphoenolpyruvate synthase [Chloroflexota bacterium]